MVTGLLTWTNLVKDTGAWQTLIFFGVLVGMADQLKKLGVIDWIGSEVADSVSGMSWMAAFAILTLVYFYVHYLFASNTAQIVAMETDLNRRVYTLFDLSAAEVKIIEASTKYRYGEV